MNREIKFRAWDAEQNKMILAFDREYKIMVNSEDGTVFCGGNLPNGDWNEPPLMQYTGIKDKNGKECYEGDLAIVNGNTCKVIFSTIFTCGWDFKILNAIGSYSMGDVCISFNSGVCIDFEIIGNIYENPELIK